MASFTELIQGEKPVLVDFYASWCGPCQTMSPILESFKSKMQEKVRVIKIDVDKNPQAASAYQIQGVPTLLLFKKGNLLWRQSGVVPVQELQRVVSPYL